MTALREGAAMADEGQEISGDCCLSLRPGGYLRNQYQLVALAGFG